MVEGEAGLGLAQDISIPQSHHIGGLEVGLGVSLLLVPGVGDLHVQLGRADGGEEGGVGGGDADTISCGINGKTQHKNTVGSTSDKGQPLGDSL